MKLKKFNKILEIIESFTNLIFWIALVIVILLSILRNESVGIEYKLIWILLALLGYTISKNHLFLLIDRKNKSSQ